MTCLDDDLVLGLVEGRLAAAVLADVDVHLDTCATCRDVIAQIARVQSPAHVLERGHAVGRYVIGDLLGAGAMGRVYSAWDPELDRRVALKLLVEPGAGARERVVREAQAMAKLDHPNVVGVHEVGTADAGVYVAMELVDGVTLRAWSDPIRPWREVVPVLVEIARGLAAVHAAGVTHRDIKPDNIIIGADGRARLGDFGLARSEASAPTASATPGLALGTPASAIAGTPAYMAPEVLRGAAADPASDQFSFGVLAYEVLTGQRPFGGTTWAALLEAIEAAPPSSLRGAPGWLDAAIRRCLAAEPAARFSSMTVLAEQLAVGAARRRSKAWLVGAAAAAAVASGVTWLSVRHAPATASCDDSAAELATVWNPEVRAALAPLGASAVASLDAWAGQWASERTGACRAAVPAPARDRCLDQRKAELGALVAHLRATPPRSSAAAAPPPRGIDSASTRTGAVESPRGIVGASTRTGVAESPRGIVGASTRTDAVESPRGIDSASTTTGAAESSRGVIGAPDGETVARAPGGVVASSGENVAGSPGGIVGASPGANAGVEPLRDSIGSDPTGADRVLDALASLASPAECRAIVAGAADPLPLDPARAAEARRVQDELPAIRAAIALGDARPVLAATEVLVDRARAAGHAPTLAEALIAHAEALRATSDLTAASKTAVDAVAAAERGHDDLLAARAWVARVAVAGDLRHLDAAQEAGAVAAAAVDRAGAPPRLAAIVLRQRGLIAYNRGLLDEARALLTEAHDRFVALSGKGSLDVATTESALGSVARAAGDLAAAEAWHRSAYQIDRALRTPQHPDLARDLHNIAGVLRLGGKLDEAAATYREALAIEIASRGANSVEAALTHNSLGLVAMGREDWAHAREELTTARDLLVAAGHGDRAFAHHNLGLVEARRGDHRTAVGHFVRAAYAYHDTLGDRSPPAVRLLLDRGRSQLALDPSDADARALLARARASAVELEIPWIAAEAETLLARAVPRPAKRPVTAPLPAVMPDIGVYGSGQTW